MAAEGLQHRGMLSQMKKQNSGWKLACYALAASLVFLVFKMTELKNSQTVAIAPYGLYSANTVVKVGDSLEESRDYIELLFRADLSMLLNWQATTVRNQFATFMTRLSPSGYKAYNLDLRDKGAKYRDSNTSQVFHLSDATMLTKDDASEFVMEAEGYLERTRGSETIIDTKVVYRLTYSQRVTGLFAIDRIETSYERTSAKASKGEA